MLLRMMPMLKPMNSNQSLSQSPKRSFHKLRKDQRTNRATISLKKLRSLILGTTLGRNRRMNPLKKTAAMTMEMKMISSKMNPMPLPSHSPVKTPKCNRRKNRRSNKRQRKMLSSMHFWETWELMQAKMPMLITTSKPTSRNCNQLQMQTKGRSPRIKRRRRNRKPKKMPKKKSKRKKNKLMMRRYWIPKQLPLQLWLRKTKIINQTSKVPIGRILLHK